MEKQKFLNTYINNMTMQEVVDSIDNLIQCQNSAYVVAVNTDVIVKIENDKYLKEITDNADLTLIDGMPLVWVSHLLKKPIFEKVSGSDLVNNVLILANNRKYSLFIIGGKEGIADKAKSNILINYNNIRRIDTYCPKFGFENDVNEINIINKTINDLCPDIVIACLGCPKQEKWVYENYKKYSAYVTICAGATVDFLAGNVKRAPKWMSNIGLEWFYRFMKEPKRLFKRYFIDDMNIVKLVLKYRRK